MKICRTLLKSLEPSIKEFKMVFIHNHHHHRWIYRRLWKRPECRFLSSSSSPSLDIGRYHRLADHALECLSDTMDAIIDKHPEARHFDTSYSMGVLTIKLGTRGTFVLNKQPPNLQIWLSSPISGPKRYDYDEGARCWIYNRDGSSLTGLMSREFSRLLNTDIDFKIPPLKEVGK